MKTSSTVHTPNCCTETNHPELRQAKRYRIVVPVSFWWIGKDEAAYTGLGNTTNISTNGAFIASASCPPVGAAIALEIHLPCLPGARREMELYGEGIATRYVDSETTSVNDNGFAVRANFYPQRSHTPEELDPSTEEPTRACEPN